MKYYLYQWEAVFIQDYVLAGGKIKTMVGASELLEAVTEALLTTAIKELGLKEKVVGDLPEKGDLALADGEVVFSRKAGGVFLMVLQNEAKANQFAQLWPILVSNFAPGIKFSAALKSGDDFAKTSKALRDELNNQKNQPQITLPESTPLTVRFQKTGKAQIEAPQKNKDGQDWTMQAKLDNSFATLAKKHLNDSKKYHFPKQFEHKNADGSLEESFPFKTTDPGNHTIAIIHPDGNGLGGYLHQIFENLNNKDNSAIAVKAYATFSKGLDEATQTAAKAATKWLIEQYEKEKNPYKDKSAHKNITPLPMRPLILGGDDLTCIVRADYAFGFVKNFTENFEKATKNFATGLKKDFGNIFECLPEILTCTTGMVFIKSNQPFSLGYQLAEGLCSEAKKSGRGISNEMPPSLVSFLHTTNTLFDEIDTQIEQELQTPEMKLSRMPYGFTEDSQRPTLESLFEVTDLFNKDDDKLLNPSAIRNLASQYHQGQADANTFWTRWQNQTEKSNKDLWKQFNTQWESLTTDTENPAADLNALFALDVINPYKQESK